MPVLTLKNRRPREAFGPESNGILMSVDEFDRADFDELCQYELVNGVLIVTPLPLEEEADPNEELGRLLRNYQEDHPQGCALNKTLAERIVRTKANRRRADRVIWAGLGRHPRRHETPTIVAEFVSSRKRDRKRDYEIKRTEYLEIRIAEYWVIDRFTQTMTVFSRVQRRNRTRVIQKNQVYRTELLPGFELPLARLFAMAEGWTDEAARS